MKGSSKKGWACCGQDQDSARSERYWQWNESLNAERETKDASLEPNTWAIVPHMASITDTVS